jgi:hypothetical protein
LKLMIYNLRMHYCPEVSLQILHFTHDGHEGVGVGLELNKKLITRLIIWVFTTNGKPIPVMVYLPAFRVTRVVPNQPSSPYGGPMQDSNSARSASSRSALKCQFCSSV